MGIAEPFTPEEMRAMRHAAQGASGDEAHVRKTFWTALKRVARNVPFAEDLVSAFYCATDPATPPRVRMILFGALAYFILPVDAVSDFLPLVGFTDDAAVLALALAAVSNAITPAHRRKAKVALDGEDRAAHA
ncbi:YkvA family protein [Chelatococcus reniformis]|uniref:DUF1232 domain-containing protein n=1 Tax=Chelatococcus reniformis TaxID=1494448 RepID=A0A916X7B5_9HYPH|nr:YkvA family protein [Chelatococcus reniformis]GGC50806.1 hypothetical protein GCM10010994_07440 [Chelatococcus reniformis]